MQMRIPGPHDVQTLSLAHWHIDHALWRIRQPLMCEFLLFHPVFDRSSILKLLGTWNEFSSLCIVLKKKPSKNHWYSIFISLILHVMSWCVDLHDSSLQNTQNTYRVTWFRIKVNYNDSGENNTICSSNHWQLLICLQMQIKVLKT